MAAWLHGCSVVPGEEVDYVNDLFGFEPKDRSASTGEGEWTRVAVGDEFSFIDDVTDGLIHLAQMSLMHDAPHSDSSCGAVHSFFTSIPIMEIILEVDC